MYCPKCGRRLILKDRFLTCEKGNMQLSGHFQELLLAAYPAEQPNPTAEIGAGMHRLYCPGCCVLLDAGRTCPNCKRLFSKNLLYNLVEFHPHLSEDGSSYV